jgi:hypothetical protein
MMDKVQKLDSAKCIIIIIIDIVVIMALAFLANRRIWLLTIMGWWYKFPMQLQPFSDVLCSPYQFQSFPIHLPEFSALIAADTPSSEAGRNWAINGH